MRRLIALGGLASFVLGACASSHGGGDEGALDPDSGRVPVAVWETFVVMARVEGDRRGPGREPDLLIDRDDVLHITHLHDDRDEILYSFGRRGTFETEVVGRMASTPEPDPTGCAQLARSVDGEVHVVFAHGELGPTTHAVRTRDGTWSLAPLPFEAAQPETCQPAVALDIADAPRFFGVRGYAAGGLGGYLGPDLSEVGPVADWRGLTLRMLFTPDGRLLTLRDAPEGLLLTVDARPAIRVTTDPPGAMGVSSDGTIHVAWVERTHDDAGEVVDRRLVLGHLAGAAVESDAAVSFDSSPQRIDLAVSDSGVVHVAFELPGEVFYGRLERGDFTYESRGIVSTQNGRPSIALDSAGEPWIAYRDRDGDLVVDHRTR